MRTEMVQEKKDPDPGRLEAALERYERPLLGYARRLLGDDEQARDVVQDVFLRLCREPMGTEDPRLKPCRPTRRTGCWSSSLPRE